MSNFKDVYTRFINLAVANEKLLAIPTIEPIERKILHLLVTYWENKQPITVVETMSITDEISTSTVFRYLKKLRQKGYVELVQDEVDNRIKYVTATKQTDQSAKMLHCSNKRRARDSGGSSGAGD